MTRHEAEVDEALSSLWEREQGALDDIRRGRLSLHHRMGELPVRTAWGRHGSETWPTSDIEVEALAREKLALARTEVLGFPWSVASSDGSGRIILCHRGTDTEYAVARIDLAKATLRAVRSEAEPLEADYATHRWSRFFLVTNTNGHIHESMHCRTTFPTTRWSWLPALSGLTEADAVAAHGPRLCSVCFPTAPVEWQAPHRKGA